MNHHPTLVMPLTTAGHPPTRCTVKISKATPIAATKMFSVVNFEPNTW